MQDQIHDLGLRVASSSLYELLEIRNYLYSNRIHISKLFLE